MSYALPPTILIRTGGRPGSTGQPLSGEWLSTLRSLDVETSVREQAVFRLKFALGMEPSGDWASSAERLFSPFCRVQIEARVDDRRRPLMNGYVTQFKMNFQSEPCQSELEIVGLDALEKLKRSTTRASNAGRTLKDVVSALYAGQDVLAPRSGVPDVGVPPPNRSQTLQAQNDLEFLRKLAEEHACEAFVEPSDDEDQGRFEPLSLAAAPRLRAPLIVHGEGGSNVRSMSFYYDLTGPTVVEARMIDAQGQPQGRPVRVELRRRIVEQDRPLLGPPGYENVRQLQGHGSETIDALTRRCQAELDRLSWVVIAKGELDTADYRELLAPRHRVDVKGASGSFSGAYVVWKVSHQFTRDRHCQKFELRRQLKVQPS